MANVVHLFQMAKNIIIYTILLCSATLSSSYSIYGRCVSSCLKCDKYYGSDYDSVGCVEDCNETRGGSIDESCQERHLNKRMDTPARECQKFCAACVQLYPDFYNGNKCSRTCVATNGQSVDPDCVNEEFSLIS